MYPRMTHMALHKFGRFFNLRRTNLSDAEIFSLMQRYSIADWYEDIAEFEKSEQLSEKKRIKYVEKQLAAVGTRVESITKYIGRQVNDHFHNRTLLQLLIKAGALYPKAEVVAWVNRVILMLHVYPIFWEDMEYNRKKYTETVASIESSNDSILIENQENRYNQHHPTQALIVIPIFDGDTYVEWYEKWCIEKSVFRTAHTKHIFQRRFPAELVAIVVSYF
jgi:hypothetical protein